MPRREVDQRKTRKALRKLREAAGRAEGEGGPGLTAWEKDFVEGVSTRLEKYGSAFRDPGKGRLEEALSARQTQVTRALTAKSRKAAKSGDTGEPEKLKPRSSFKSKDPKAAKKRAPLRGKAKPAWTPRIRDINDDPMSDPAPPKPPAFKVIRGGK